MNLIVKDKPRLIAIAISHSCEKVRWALDYLDIDYVEEDHAPPSHRQYTFRHDGKIVPVLVTKNEDFTNSHAILEYLNSISENKKLYPVDPELCNQVDTLEMLFDEKLGGATRTWGYYYAIQKPLAVAIAWGINAPLIERIKAILVFPLIPRLLSQMYDVTSETKDLALAGIREVFEIVNQELDSGKQLLVGDRLSAADITFAALVSPILRPHNHPIYNSDLSKMSTERLDIVKDLRETSAGKFALRLYQQYRI